MTNAGIKRAKARAASQSGADQPTTAPLPHPEIAVVVPTFNEISNVEKLVERVSRALDGREFEIIFVDDDSPDGTADKVRKLAAGNGRIRCLHRVGRRGLSGAVIEGILATTAPVAAVIDGDLQHDETRLPEMLARIETEGAEVVVGTRYADGGGVGDWDRSRQRISRLATAMAQRLLGVSLSDPMSGFFVIRTEPFRRRAHGLTGVGYKILLDILSAPGPALRVAEVPYEFRSREAGESKLDNKVVLEFLELLIARTIGRWVPTKFVMFSLVGALGVVVHMAVLTSLFRGGLASFGAAQATATLVAMTFNFFVNNFFTYFDRRLRGWQLLPGWLSFCAASSVGAVANVGVAVYLFREWDTVWFASALAGVVVGAAWNYAVTALYTWKGNG